MAAYQATGNPDVFIRTADGARVMAIHGRDGADAFAAWMVAGHTPDPAPAPTQLTATQFLNRFPPAAIAALAANPSTLVLLITLAAATSIDLTDPQVVSGINGLVPAILTQAQATAILTP